VARYVVPRGVSRSIPSTAFSDPAVLPSYAVNRSDWVAPRVKTAKTSARLNLPVGGGRRFLDGRQSPLHRLAVKVKKTRIRIVGFLHGLVRFAAIEFIELLPAVVRVGIQRFVPIQRTDLRLDRSIRRTLGAPTGTEDQNPMLT